MKKFLPISLLLCSTLLLGGAAYSSKHSNELLIALNTASMTAPYTETAIINDPDGYTNVRAQPSGKSKVIARLYDNEPFYTYQQNGDWWQVKTKSGIEGYMHKSRITLQTKPQTQISTNSLLAQVFNGDMLGTNLRYFESIAGIPRESYDYIHTFNIDNCIVNATAPNNKITSLRLVITPHCQADLSSFLHSYAPESHLPLTTGNFIDAAGGGLNYLADCLAGCGNAYDPSVYAHWTGPRAVNFIEVVLETTLTNGKALDAAGIWREQMESSKGEDYVLDVQFNCSHDFNNIAHSAFQDVPINAITIGYDLITPNCLN